MHANALEYARVLYFYQQASNIVVVLKPDSCQNLVLLRDYDSLKPMVFASTNIAFRGLRRSVGCLMILLDAASRVNINYFRWKVDLDAENSKVDQAQMSSESKIYSRSDFQHLFGAVNGKIVANSQAQRSSSFSYNQSAA